MSNVLEIETPLIDAAFILIVLILFQPVKDRVDELIARLFLRDRADPRAVMETFSRQIAAVFDDELVLRKGRDGAMEVRREAGLTRRVEISFPR